MMINGVEKLRNQVGNNTHPGFDYKTDNCYRKPVFSVSCQYINPNTDLEYRPEVPRDPNDPMPLVLKDYCDPYADFSSWDEFMGTVGAIGGVVNLLVLVLPLALYILL